MIVKTSHSPCSSSQDARPINVMFAITSMPVGGAETLLVNLVRRLGQRFRPQICCLKEPGPLGEEIAGEIPVHSRLFKGKWDLRVLPRLKRLMRKEKIDALITVGAGDKMFWGRLAARWARVPCILSALHSTGWPDGVGRLNRLLTPLTDGFIAVAKEHGQFLVDFEKFPEEKVFVIPNGVDIDRFQPDPAARQQVRQELGVTPTTPLTGIVAALRPEKNHQRFLRVARRVHEQLPESHFVIVGDGPLRSSLEQQAVQDGLGDRVHFLGTRSDIPRLLAALDLFAPAAILTLAGGAIFGFWKGFVLVSFASTIGATIAFLLTRYLFHDSVQRRFGERLKTVNQGIQAEGAFYVFGLRLVPLFPFVMVNSVLALTKLKTTTYYWSSQLGMVPGTAVYVYAGTQLAEINDLKDILSPGMILAFVLLGVFPIIAKKTLAWLKQTKRSTS